MVRVRFAPSPTGSLHLGGALTAVANRRFADEHGGTFVLRIDDTDVVRTEAGSEEEILRELEWLGIDWDEGPVRQSERADRHRQAAREIGTPDAEGALRFQRATLVRADGRPAYQLASVVDDLDLGITHVIRGKDLLPSTRLQEAIARALGASPPEFIHHGLLVGDDGRKLSKRERSASVGGLRELGIPPEAVRAYLEELDLPRGDVHYDEARLRRLAVEALGALSDEELAARAGVDRRFGPALRGARDLVEARAIAEQLSGQPSARADELSRDPSAVSRAPRGRSRRPRQGGGEGDRPRAQGGRRRPQGAPPGAHGRRARPGALGGAGGATARRGSDQDRLSYG